MTIDILSVLSLIGGLIAVISAIWQVSEIKNKIYKEISSAKTELNQRLERDYDHLEDLIKELDNNFKLYKELKAETEKNIQLTWSNEFHKILQKYQTVRKDIHDLQQFAQNKHGFKIRINSPTLSNKDDA